VNLAFLFHLVAYYYFLQQLSSKAVEIPTILVEIPKYGKKMGTNLLRSLMMMLYLSPAIFSGAGADGVVETCSGIVPMRYRNDKISITDFGGVGDGKTVNTKAFRAAIFRIEHLRRRGGTLLYIPPGVYLTDRFNLTSRMTLYLASGAVIKATQVSLFAVNL